MTTTPIKEYTHEELVTAAKDGKVEIELSYDLSISRPTSNTNGELTFKDYDCNPKGESVKVRVPVEATTSKTKLEEYIQEEYSNNFCEMVCPSNINIWDEDKGEFRFPLD